jgi:hypothetical protein
VEIDENEIAIGDRRFERCDDVGGDASRGCGSDVDGEKALRFGGLFNAPFVGALAARGEIFGAGSGLRE